jgi:hypothetical protein
MRPVVSPRPFLSDLLAVASLEMVETTAVDARRHPTAPPSLPVTSYDSKPSHRLSERPPWIPRPLPADRLPSTPRFSPLDASPPLPPPSLHVGTRPLRPPRRRTLGSPAPRVLDRRVLAHPTIARPTTRPRRATSPRETLIARNDRLDANVVSNRRTRVVDVVGTRTRSTTARRRGAVAERIDTAAVVEMSGRRGIRGTSRGGAIGIRRTTEATTVTSLRRPRTSTRLHPRLATCVMTTRAGPPTVEPPTAGLPTAGLPTAGGGTAITMVTIVAPRQDRAVQRGTRRGTGRRRRSGRLRGLMHATRTAAGPVDTSDHPSAAVLTPLARMYVPSFHSS